MSFDLSFQEENLPVCECLKVPDSKKITTHAILKRLKMCTKRKSGNYPRVKSLLEDYPNAVYHSLLGNVAINKNLVVLENHNIILRRDYMSMQGKVRIIGGGGAGLDPAEVGFIGRGMLTASVFGEMFSAPSAEEILVAIRELAVGNTDGILLLVKNYIGDKLNFGLALDKAVSEDIKVKILVIGDDASEPVLEKHGRRALAGSVLVYKIAGELAEQGISIEEIIDECRDHILTDLATISVNLPACGKTFCESLSPFIQPNEMVLGMGVYGDHGKKRTQFCNVSNAVSIVLEDILSFSKSNFKVSHTSVVVLINNYGSTSKFEESIIAHEVQEQLSKKGIIISLLYAGTFISSSNSNGFSITLLKVNSSDTLKHLEAPTSATAWPKPQLFDFSIRNTTKFPNVIKPVCQHEKLNDSKYQSMEPGPTLSEKGIAALKQSTIFAAEALISCEKQLNIIDSEAGDGDAGTVLRKGAEALKKAVTNDELDIARPAKFLNSISRICSQYMGGITGALYSIFFSSAAKVFQNADKITPELCSNAFKAAVKAIKHYGKAELGDRTILDVLCPAVDSFDGAITKGQDLTVALYMAAATCEFKAEEIKLKRPRWQDDLKIDKPLLYTDPGAHGATIWLRAMTFDSDTPTTKPGIFLWKFFTKEECNELLKDDDSEENFNSYVEKKIEDVEPFLLLLLSETFTYCSQEFHKEPKRTSSLLGMVYYAHIYFTASMWRSPSEVYYYFKESLLNHCIEFPPTSIEIFHPEEARNVLKFFHEFYIRNLPLVRLLHVPNYRLQLKLKDNEFVP